MSRKHYEATARALRQARVDLAAGQTPAFVLDELQRALGAMFARDNPRFDRGRFDVACNK